MTDRPLTLGSLFDGSGGFPLAGLINGIEPIWVSEIEPFPIRVTTKRIPQMKHLGDINTINGAEVTPVDIITAGFCCQDLSVAGKREGLHGERSGLFFQIIRIIKEMRAATNNEYPKYALLENVPGLYISNNGMDFQEVLNELVKIKSETLSVPMPEKWNTAGEIMGDSFSVGWRTLDSQFFGVPQRRRRCFIVVDFKGERAGEILFDETRLRGNPPPCGFPWKGTAGNPSAGTGNSVCVLSDQAVFDARGNGDGNIAPTITGDHNNRITDYTAISVGARHSTLPISDDMANTLTSCDHTGAQCVCFPSAFMGGQGAKARSIAFSDKITPTLRSEAGGNSVPMTVYGICSKSSNSMKSSNPHSGIYEAETARTLDTSIPDPNKNAGGMAVVALEGNGSRPSHRGDGYSDEDIAYTLNSVEKHGIAYAMTTDSYLQVCKEQSPTLMSRDFKGAPIVNRAVVENHSHGGYRKVDKAGTLKASGGDMPGGENMVIENHYIVRRLTPTECALLQGFPPNWCDGLETPEPSEDDITYWSEVWETHRKIIGKSSRLKSRNQIVKWLRDPYSDAAAYKMWGNGIALPCAVFILGGIAEIYNKKNEETT